jgi:hypothetical protein
MALIRALALLGVLALGAVGPAPGALAEPEETLDQKHADAVRKMEQLFYEHQIETKRFTDVMPLTKFLAALEEQLPKDKKIALRIDQEAFGDSFAEVAATPIVLPPHPKEVSVGWALELARKRIKTKHDYRIDGTAFVITTPGRALYTAVYDIRDAIAKPETIAFFQSFWNAVPGSWDAFQENVRGRNREPAERAALVVRAIVSHVELGNPKQGSIDPATVQVLNATRLVIRTNAAKHSEVGALLRALRSLGDVTVAVKAQLYEVDDAFFTKLKNVKPVDWEELEREFLAGVPATGESLFKLLDKHTMLQAGDEVMVDDGMIAGLLSRHQALTFLPSRAQVVKGDKSRQTVLAGVAFLAGVRVGADRRFVRMRLTEKGTEVLRVKKEKVLVDNTGNEAEAETPLLKEAVHTRDLEIPDGGSMLVPVHYRPPSVQEKNRHWVLWITPRIIIEEEERLIHQQALVSIAPMVVANVLKNPRLKSVREFYGDPGDRRLALADSAAWAWPKVFDVPGYERASADPKGKKLLGIRIDRVEPERMDGANRDVMVTLMNAGGSANRAVLGECTVRYRARPVESGWTLELAEDGGR